MQIDEAQGKKAAIEKPAPAYPAAARQLKITGEVHVEAVVDEAGAVADVNVISGNAVLTKPCVEAVKKWCFQPFKSNGQSAKASVSLHFEFGAR